MDKFPLLEGIGFASFMRSRKHERINKDGMFHILAVNSKPNL